MATMVLDRSRPLARGIAVVLVYALCVIAFPAYVRAQAQEAARVSDTSILTPELTAARAGLEKYRDPILAVHDGYFSTLACIEYPDGGMGVHFLNPASIGSTLDPAKPNVLIYEPVGDKLLLAAAEWFVPLATGVKERPTIFGQPFDGPMEGHEPVQPAGLHHYDLHVWLWRSNPAGMFHNTNPDLKCPEATYSLREQMPHMVSGS